MPEKPYVSPQQWAEISAAAEAKKKASKKPPAKLHGKSMIKAAGLNSLITFTVLLLAWVSGFASRLFAVIRFESIIHEFDPW